MAEETQQQQQDQATGQGDTGSAPDNNRDVAPKVFTQADIDRIVKERLQREREKYSDYEELKRAAERLKKIEDAQKSEQERLQEQLAALQAERDRALAERQEALIRSAVIGAAQRMRFRDPEDAVRMLDLAKVTLDDDGRVIGVEEQLEQLAKSKPYLLQQQASVAPTNPGRGHETGETPEQRRARLFGGGAPVIGGTETGGLFWPQPR